MTFATLFSKLYILLAQESQSKSEKCECVLQNHFQPGIANLPEAVVFTISFCRVKARWRLPRALTGYSTGCSPLARSFPDYCSVVARVLQENFLPWPSPPGPAGSRPWFGLAVLYIVSRVDCRLPVTRVLCGLVGVVIGGRLASDSDGPCRAASPPATPAEKKL
jgi:hypothetical protein